MLYDNESWTMKRTEKRLVSPEMCFMRRAVGYTPSDHEIN
jgi:hypothetical protein